jgi:hypothetical protein
MITTPEPLNRVEAPAAPGASAERHGRKESAPAPCPAPRAYPAAPAGAMTVTARAGQQRILRRGFKVQARGDDRGGVRRPGSFGQHERCRVPSPKLPPPPPGPCGRPPTQPAPAHQLRACRRLRAQGKRRTLHGIGVQIRLGRGGGDFRRQHRNASCIWRSGATAIWLWVQAGEHRHGVLLSLCLPSVLPPCARSWPWSPSPEPAEDASRISAPTARAAGARRVGAADSGCCFDLGPFLVPNIRIQLSVSTSLH